MMKITLQQNIGAQTIEYSMQGPRDGIELAKAHMFANSSKYGFVKGVPIMMQIDFVSKNAMSYTLDHQVVTL